MVVNKMEQNKFQPKIVVIGEECKVLQPIILISKYTTIGVIALKEPVSDIGQIELIAKNYTNNQDLIFVIPQFKERSKGKLYLGYWNDGILE